jgi:kinesin family protein 20
MDTYEKQKPSATPDGHKSLRKKFVRTLKGKPALKETYGEPMKVYLRVRPLSESELIAGESQDCLQFEDDTSIVVQPPNDSASFKNQSRTGMHAVHRFDFSHVFGPETSQKNLFKDTTLDVVKDFVRGQNCLTFSYGVTNAGKVS